jgi:GTP-binding protein
MKIKSADFMRGIVGTNPILYDGLPQVAFVGRSNVGKSSVINSLVNRKELVKVGKKPGKTTELNFFLINNNIYFVDLPGYGFAKADIVKQEKIRKLILWYLMYSEVKPHLIVMILDIKAGFTDYDKDIISVLRDQGHPYVIVANKIDKLNQKDLNMALAEIKKVSSEAEIIPFSTVGDKRSGDLLGRILSM